MSTSETATDGSKARFASLSALISAEWPQVPPEALTATAGDLDEVINLVAERTEHTRAYVRRQVEELSRLADEKGVPRSAAEVEALVGRLEARTRELAQQVEREVLPKLEAKAKENLGRSLLTALGIGFILGLLFGGLFRGRH